MPLSQPNDYEIQLKQGADLQKTIGHSLLYKMSAEQFEALKKYMCENLNKGFIVSSQSLYVFPMLMAWHLSGKLKFCVNYQKSNLIMKKDCYLLPLIDKLMDQIQGAKVFTKLDVWQGFHHIQMSPELQQLTTFWHWFGTYQYKVILFGLVCRPAIFQTVYEQYTDGIPGKFCDCIHGQSADLFKELKGA